MLASIDPGVRHCGVALWNEGVLVRAYLCIQRPKEGWLAFLAQLPDGVTDGVMEVPQVYPGSPVRPEDLIQLAASAGAIAGRIGGNWTQARPAAWTKATTTRKEVRLARAEARLSADERKTVELPRNKARCADVWDAVALGLWYLNRW